MPSYNKVILMGHLTRDPELDYTKSGTSMCKFALAVNHKYGDKESVGFFDITVFGGAADSCSKYLVKGSACLVEGRLEQQRWETDDGQKRSKIGVVANTVQFLYSKFAKQEDDSQDIPF